MRKPYSDSSYVGQFFWVKNGDEIPWLEQGNNYNGLLTAVVGAGEALVDVDKRASSDVAALADSKKVIIRPENGTVSMEIRFRSDGTSAGDQEIVELHACAGDDHYAFVEEFTIDRGTQEFTSSIFYYDTIVPAKSDLWMTPIGIISDTLNHMGRIVMNTHGCDKFCLVWTTKDANTTNLYVDWRRH